MRLAAFNGSSRKNGNTRILLEIICDETRRAGIDSEIISLSDFPLRGCLGCFACKGQARCITIDDGFNDCFAKMREADGIVLGSPVYSADVSAPMKAFWNVPEWSARPIPACSGARRVRPWPPCAAPGA